MFSKVARSALAILVLSAENERVFSVGSNTMTEKKTAILLQNVNGLIIIKSNARFIKSENQH